MSQEEFVTQVLEYWGLSVTKIPETDDKTPDFLATGGDSSYLIELKTKSPNPDLLKERDAALNAGELFDELTTLVRRNRLSGIVRSASKQLDTYDADDSFQIVWLHSEGHSASAHMYQFEVTLYGSTTIADFSEKGTAGDCYYFTNSDFHRYRHVLDGAIISTRDEAKICLNPLSKKYEDMKKSFLCTTLKEGICDPYAREKEGVAYIVDGEVNRDNKEEILKFLRDKYNQEKLIDMHMNQVSVTTEVRHEK